MRSVVIFMAENTMLVLLLITTTACLVLDIILYRKIKEKKSEEKSEPYSELKELLNSENTDWTRYVEDDPLPPTNNAPEPPSSDKPRHLVVTAGKREKIIR